MPSAWSTLTSLFNGSRLHDTPVANTTTKRHRKPGKAKSRRQMAHESRRRNRAA